MPAGLIPCQTGYKWGQCKRDCQLNLFKGAVLRALCLSVLHFILPLLIQSVFLAQASLPGVLGLESGESVRLGLRKHAVSSVMHYIAARKEASFMSCGGIESQRWPPSNSGRHLFVFKINKIIVFATFIFCGSGSVHEFLTITKAATR